MAIEPFASATKIHKFYAAECIHLWKSMKLGNGEPLDVQTPSIGFIPVYDSEAKAKKDFPDSDIHVLVVSVGPKM